MVRSLETVSDSLEQKCKNKIGYDQFRIFYILRGLPWSTLGMEGKIHIKENCIVNVFHKSGFEWFFFLNRKQGIYNTETV